MFITKGLLEKHGACKSQVDKFVELFPDGVVPTRDLCSAHAQTFSFAWARFLLSPPAREAYNEAVGPARKAYYEAIVSARKAFDEVLASEGKVYDETVAAARKVYDEAAASASKAYDEAVAAARKVYNEAVVPAWFDASQLECEEVGLMAEKDTGEWK